MKRPEMQTHRLAFVDALRGWAILGVMAVHCAQTVPGIWPGREYLAFGAFGVQLFYLVSAFTLCWVTYYLHKDNGSWRPFFIRRFLRIAPMYYVAIVICLVIYIFSSKDGIWSPIVEKYLWWSGGSERVSAAHVFANLIFFHGFNPFWINSLVPGGWTITVEFTFYAVFPFLFVHASTMWRACVLTALSMVAAASAYLILKGIQPISPVYLWQNYLYMWFPAQLPFFCLGIILFQFYRWLSDRSFANASFLGVMLISVSLSLLVFLASGGRVWLFPRHWTIGIAFAGLAAGLACNPMRFFVNVFTEKLGQLSYSCYIWHWFVISTLTALRDLACAEITYESPFLSFVATSCSVIALSAALSWLTWNYIEIPAIRLGKAFSKRAHSV
ncbi:MAG: acyltransferase [Desulfomonile tiedjei]|uniref:Acyltransferase n=1 Tax=Desulfomonile tiedjei TaxID=2358 RepID=A0A9D6V5M8_9BACT|nr:acyltransferase [Desulfomonile tiedjei]